MTQQQKKTTNASSRTAQDTQPDNMDLQDIAQRSQKMLLDFFQRHQGGGAAQEWNWDPFNVAPAFMELFHIMMNNPQHLANAQMELWQSYMNLWQHSWQKWFGGGESDPLVAPEKGDKRFKDPSWDENVVFDYIKQSYLLTSRWLRSVVNVDGLDERTAQKVDFYTKQFVDALAPSNFLLTNPEALKATLDSKGENLIKGLQNLLDDLEQGEGQLKISMTDVNAFEVGKNVAITPGKVVYQNKLMQLIQYTPTTKEVATIPLIIIPPWINKYYILDLREKNSFVKWAVDQGLTVFMISWVNPDEKLAAKDFEDYMFEGPLAALDQVAKITGQKQANMIGYCLGGTLLAAMLSYMEQKKDDRVKSATFFTTMTDFSDAGDLSVFIDEEQLQALENKMNEKGYLDGSSMATTFNMLRANDLIWSFVVNNYLLGKEPFPFDLLFWNSDTTRMPAKMHSFYLRKMYHENKLVEAGGISLGGVPIDLRKVKTPSFMLSTREDHIAPWLSTFAATNLFQGPVKFCLSASGHIAGVINPPAADKYCYWMNARKVKDPEAWLRGATEHPGSWWPAWREWLEEFNQGKVPARKIDAKTALEEAPGSYVKVRS